MIPVTSDTCDMVFPLRAQHVYQANKMDESYMNILQHEYILQYSQSYILLLTIKFESINPTSTNSWYCILNTVRSLIFNSVSFQFSAIRFMMKISFVDRKVIL